MIEYKEDLLRIRNIILKTLHLIQNNPNEFDNVKLGEIANNVTTTIIGIFNEVLEK